MQFVSGNIWSMYQKENNKILVTTNGVITNKGVVMGAGIALEAKHMEPNLPFVLAHKACEKTGYRYPYQGILEYGVLFNPMWSIGAFQTKHHFKHDSPLELLKLSTDQLSQIAQEHEHFVFNLNFPGIGFGRLNPAMVKPIIETLPSNVNIWSK